ncbi:hypothetical protein Afil01_69180 [Actinorhabdospora filicis]|uniref:GrpB family protein n=1 Tax=Actinorhabdospora filicis TaxID=1785913 RepID=A0A9W6STA9_9ACTN|nr:GrpB family protein [Actinorhabdospora filicis]GLZ82111.1 hypothetical protein Afil01_69180 [Actinorhabdospora filicis]
MTTVPAWAYERLTVHDYDPNWPQRAAETIEELLPHLRPWLADGIEHVGSTAIPGMAAKPVIDLMASVTNLDAITTHMELPTDWHYVPPELDGRPWRRFFVKTNPQATHRQAHLHVMTAGHPRWAEQKNFRDALRANQERAKEYADLKRRLAEEHGNDREAYTDAKGEFVARVMREMGQGQERGQE